MLADSISRIVASRGSNTVSYEAPEAAETWSNVWFLGFFNFFKKKLFGFFNLLPRNVFVFYFWIFSVVKRKNSIAMSPFSVNENVISMAMSSSCTLNLLFSLVKVTSGVFVTKANCNLQLFFLLSIIQLSTTFYHLCSLLNILVDYYVYC